MKKLNCEDGELAVELNKEYDFRSVPVWDEYERKSVLWHTQIFRKDGKPATPVVRDELPLSIVKPYRDKPIIKILTLIGYDDDEAKEILDYIQSEFLKIPKGKIEQKIADLKKENADALKVSVGKYYSVTVGQEGAESETIKGVIDDVGQNPYRCISMTDGNGNKHFIFVKHILKMSEETNKGLKG